MSIPKINPAHPNLTSPTDQKASQIDANLRLATEHAQPIRLRRLLHEFRDTQPDAHKVTGALLLATQQRYTERIKASKGTQSDEDEENEEEEEEDEDDEEESESDGSTSAREISELSSEEEEPDEDSIHDSDDDKKRSELGSGEEDDGTDEERASTTTSIRQMPVKHELR